MTETIQENKTKDKIYWLPCLKCNTQTRHKVVFSVNISNDEPISTWEDFEIVECQGCKTLSFRKNFTSEDDVDFDEDGEIMLSDHEELYPVRLVGRHLLRGSYRLPERIIKIYYETHSALCNKLHILAGVGVRALLEVICADNKAKGENLEMKIDNLVTLGVLTNGGSEILHSLRLIGNLAAHEVEPLSVKDLNIALDVVENLLQSVYLLPLEAKNLPKRKKEQP